MKKSNAFWGGLLAGAAVGAILTLLYTPKRGKEVRELMKDKLKELGMTTDELLHKLKKEGVSLEAWVKGLGAEKKSCCKESETLLAEENLSTKQDQAINK